MRASPVAALGAVAGDAVAELVEASELLDVDMDELAGMLALVAADRLSRLGRLHLPDSEPPQPAADGSRPRADGPADPLAGPALAAKRLNARDHRHWSRTAQPVRAR